jgi:hypothetical protein
MIKRRTSISIETRRVIWLRQQQRRTLWCSECRAQASMVSIDETARLANVSTLEICRLINDNRIHFTETSDGLLLVCADSLPGRVTKSSSRSEPA